MHKFFNMLIDIMGAFVEFVKDGCFREKPIGDEDRGTVLGGHMLSGIDSVMGESAALFPCQCMVGLDFPVAKLESDRVVVVLFIVPDVEVEIFVREPAAEALAGNLANVFHFFHHISPRKLACQIIARGVKMSNF